MEAERRLEFMRAMSGSCNCVTKTPEAKYHDKLCYYRLLKEKEEQIELEEELEKANDLLSEIEEDSFFLDPNIEDDDDFFKEPYHAYDGDHSYNDDDDNLPDAESSVSQVADGMRIIAKVTLVFCVLYAIYEVFIQ